MSGLNEIKARKFVPQQNLMKKKQHIQIVLGPLTNITHYSSYIIQLGFHKNTHHIEPQNYTISIKSSTRPNLKPVTTRHL